MTVPSPVLLAIILLLLWPTLQIVALLACRMRVQELALRAIANTSRMAMANTSRSAKLPLRIGAHAIAICVTFAVALYITIEIGPAISKSLNALTIWIQILGN